MQEITVPKGERVNEAYLWFLKIVAAFGVGAWAGATIAKRVLRRKVS